MDFLTERLSFDFGTSNLRIVKNGRLVLEEPCQVEINEKFKVIATGNNVSELTGNKIIYPIQKGVIADFNVFEQFLRISIKKFSKHKKLGILYPSIKAFVIVPDAITEVEMRAVRDSLEHAGAREVYMLYSSLAIYEELKQEHSEDFLLIDAGAGKIGFSLFESGKLTRARKLELGSVKLKEVLKLNIKRNFHVAMNETVIENIFYNYITVFESPKIYKSSFQGIDSYGRSILIELNIEKLIEYIDPYFRLIENEIFAIIGESVSNNLKKIILTGGLGQVNGLASRLERTTKLHVLDKSRNNYLLSSLMKLDSKFENLTFAMR